MKQIFPSMLCAFEIQKVLSYHEKILTYLTNIFIVLPLHLIFNSFGIIWWGGCHASCGILVPQPGIEPRPSEQEHLS